MKEKLLSKINPKVVVPIAVGAVLAVVGIIALAVSLLGRGGSVTQAQAVELALAHAGVEQQDAASLSAKEDDVDGRAVYEVEFSAGGTEYHYDVARKGGEIVNYNYDRGGRTPGAQEEKDDSQAAAVKATPSPEAAASSAPEKEQAQDVQATAKPDSAGQAVTEEQAKAIALEHAGLTEGDTNYLQVQADWDDGRPVYDVEFHAAGTEYDYEVSQDTGEILKYSSDVRRQGGNGNGNGNGKNASSTAITLEEATQLVLDRVPGAAGENVRIEADWDDGRQIYEGELYFERAEYEFEIDASTGNFIEWSVDYQD